MKRTNVYLNEKLLKKLKHKAVDKETSVSALIRTLIKDYLERENQDDN